MPVGRSVRPSNISLASRILPSLLNFRPLALQSPSLLSFLRSGWARSDFIKIECDLIFSQLNKIEGFSLLSSHLFNSFISLLQLKPFKIK